MEPLNLPTIETRGRKVSTMYLPSSGCYNTTVYDRNVNKILETWKSFSPDEARGTQKTAIEKYLS